MPYALVGFGLLLLIIGSEAVVRGGVGLSRRFGLSPLLIGLLVVSAGTSAPELVVSLEAGLHNAPGLALGNVVGSNIVNILLILGLGAVLRPIPTSRAVIVREGTILIAASSVFLVMVRAGEVSRVDGLLLLTAFAAYVTTSFITERRRPSPLSAAEAHVRDRPEREPTFAMSMIILLFGLACLYFGGNYVVDGGVAIALLYHVAPAVIGLTIVAFGSSLPELATTIVASIRGETSLAIGNLVGSNIFNILFVTGTAASVHPLQATRLLGEADIFVMLGAAVALPAMLLLHRKLTRPQGAVLVAGYVAYLVFLAWRQGHLGGGA